MYTTQYLRQISESVANETYKGQKTSGMSDGGVFRDMMVQMAAEKSRVRPDAGKRANEFGGNAGSDRGSPQNTSGLANGADGLIGAAGYDLLRMMTVDPGTAQLTGQLSADTPDTENADTVDVSLPVFMQVNSETADVGAALASERNIGSAASFKDISQMMANLGERPVDTGADSGRYFVKNDTDEGILTDARAYTGRQEFANTVMNELKPATPAAAGQTAAPVLNAGNSEIIAASGDISYGKADTTQIPVSHLQSDQAGLTDGQFRAAKVDVSSETGHRAENHGTAFETSSTPVVETKASDPALPTFGFSERNRFTMDETGIRDVEETEQIRPSIADVQVKQGGSIGETITKSQDVKPEPYAQIAQVISNKQSEGVKVFSVMLEPADLGRIDVNLKQLHGKMIISITAECVKTQELLAQQAPKLISMLGMNSLHVESVQIFGQETQLTHEGYQQSFHMNLPQRETGDSRDFERKGKNENRGTSLEGDMLGKNETESYYEGLMDLKA